MVCSTIVDEARSAAVTSYFATVMYVVVLATFLRFSIPSDESLHKINAIRVLLMCACLFCLSYHVATTQKTYKLWRRLQYINRDKKKYLVAIF